MKLTAAHIEELFTFTQQHYVEYYDVQLELVDHLANDIEAIWKQEPHLSFEQAKAKAFQKFGIFGFMPVVEAKHKQLSKKYFKLLGQFLKEWFALPKILLTAVLFYCCFLIQEVPYGIEIYIGSYFALIISELIFLFTSKRKLEKKKREEGKIWMLEHYIWQQGLSGFTLIILNVLQFAVPRSNVFTDLSMIWRLVFAGLLGLCVLIAYINQRVIPQKSEAILREQYPEYSL